ncbi:MAG: hypothetical protein NVS3B24_03880 [Candidatus Dormibacteria bacterium]
MGSKGAGSQAKGPGLLVLPRQGHMEHRVAADARALVLIVEDDAAICEMYSLALRLGGYEVQSAASGGSAIEAAVRLVPDVVLLDVGLPDRPGTEVLTELKRTERTAAIPVAMLSNYSEPDIIARALREGAATYMVKAEITPAQVVMAVAELVQT